MVNINMLATFVASLAGPILGYLWYSVLFAKPWQKLAGVTDAQMQKGMPMRAASSYVLTLVMSIVLTLSIGPDAPGLYGLTAGFFVGLGWVGLAMGVNNIFEHRPVKLWLINAGYNVVLFSIMGLIIGMF